jgi:hypothetical protein
VNSLGAAFGGTVLCILQTLSAQADGASSIWEAAFPIAAAPAHVYFRALYIDGLGQSHILEVWRDADRRLRRKTDDAIDLYVTMKASGEPDYHIVDHKRGAVIHADRLTLYRMGRFSGWLGLAHVLDAPRGAYTVTSLPKAPASKSTGQCAWFRLEVAEPVRTLNDVCWSARWGLPLEINSTDANGDSATARFSVERVNEFQPTDAIFDIGQEPLNIDARTDGDVSD